MEQKEVELVLVVKDGREMQCNPNGVAELSKFGWKLKGEDASVDEAVKKAAEAAEAAKLFESLAAQCKEKGIKVTAADTAETLYKKLSA